MYCGKPVQTHNGLVHFAWCWNTGNFSRRHIFSRFSGTRFPISPSLLGLTTRFRWRTIIPCQISKRLCTARYDSHPVTNTLPGQHTILYLAIRAPGPTGAWAVNSVTEKKSRRRFHRSTYSITRITPLQFPPSSSPSPSRDSASVPCFPSV